MKQTLKPLYAISRPIEGKSWRVHRLVWWLEHGTLPPCLDHLCRNEACANPDHLEPTDIKTNILRGVGPTAANKRKERCKRGHTLKGYNLITRKDKKGRECRTCRQMLQRKWRRKQRG